MHLKTPMNSLLTKVVPLYRSMIREKSYCYKKGGSTIKLVRANVVFTCDVLDERIFSRDSVDHIQIKFKL